MIVYSHEIYYPLNLSLSKVGPPSFLPAVKKRDRLRKSLNFIPCEALWHLGTGIFIIGTKCPLICHMPFPICNLANVVSFTIANSFPQILCKVIIEFVIALLYNVFKSIFTEIWGIFYVKTPSGTSRFPHGKYYARW